MMPRFRLLFALAMLLALTAATPAAAQLASYVDTPSRGVTRVEQANPLPVNPVVRAAAIDRGAAIGTTAVTLMPANANRRGFAVQVQSTSASCYLNGQATATADLHSLQVGPGGYFETATNVGTGALSIVCTGAATPVFAREW